MHGHRRQTTLKPFQVIKSMDVDKEVTLGKSLEYHRKILVGFVNVLSFGQLNKCSFEQFYSESKQG